MGGNLVETKDVSNGKRWKWTVLSGFMFTEQFENDRNHTMGLDFLMVMIPGVEIVCAKECSYAF